MAITGTRFRARVCAGCGKSGGTTPILGAYWHPRCFRKATPEERDKARQDVVNDPQSLVRPH